MIKNVVKSWAFLEMIQPKEIPNMGKDLNEKLVKGDKKFKEVVPLKWSKPLFDELELDNPARDLRKYTYYLGAYRNFEIVSLLREFFKNEENIINKSFDLYYSFSFDVTDDGKFMEDSLSIPYVQLIIDDIKRIGDISYDDFTDRYELKMQSFTEDLMVIFQNGVEESTLKKAEKSFGEYFSYVTSEINSGYVQCKIYNKKRPPQDNNFNSFYLEDLQLILKQGENNTLSHFVQGVDVDIDIDENREAIEEILKVENLPAGRWPSPVNHRLSLMQQVSVNHILQTENPVSSVNGPPGTGKTTLLKDIFAQLIVERAKEMVKYNNPTDAFKQVGKQSIYQGAYDYNMYELDPEIAKYSMVVASSNNGAVENISKELPLLDEIIRSDEVSNEKKEEDLSIFERYDQLYAREAKNLDFFPEYAEILLEDEQAWGLFSGAFGKGSNLNKINGSLQNKENGDLSFLQHLEDEKLPVDAWENAVTEFNDLYNEIQAEKEDLQKYVQLMEQVTEYKDKLSELSAILIEEKEHEVSLTNHLNSVEKEEGYIEAQLDNLPSVGFFTKLLRMFTGNKDETEVALREERADLLRKQSVIFKDIQISKKKLKELNNEKENIEFYLEEAKALELKFAKEEVVLSTDDFWAEDSYDERQISVLWQTHSLNFKRGLLFLKAMQVHKIFMHKNHSNLKVSINMFNNLRSLNLNITENKENIGRMWKTLHLIFPVMSTTFASLGSMYRGMEKDFIDYLFIDEAGQASPQQAAGGLWRAKHAIVVGDPIQIEPVVTLDETILSDIRKAFKISERYIGPTASAQTVADYANPLGTYKGEGKNKERIGIPLWVHRRCIEPMFSISNEIAYDNKMVLAMDGYVGSEWFDVEGKAGPAQYVGDQGQFIVQEIEKQFLSLTDGEVPSIFIITPFTAVKNELIRLINSQLGKKFSEISNWTKNSIGTVHTFQGKEADIVYFMTGTDKETDGAANWSCMKPNILNVAVTRAKKEFYVVGDLERFKKKQYYDVMVDQIKAHQK